MITLFYETRPQDFYVGGEPTPVAIRVVIDHIARHSRNTVDRQRIATQPAVKGAVPRRDRQAPLAAQHRPPLTTVHQPVRELGAQALSLLIDLIEGRAAVPQRLVLPTELIVRESCGWSRRLVSSLK